MSLRTFDQDDDGKTHVLAQADAFALELKETPTTGYRWHLDIAQGLTLQSVEFVSATDAPPGAGGMRRWIFQIDRAGQYCLQAKLWREWQGESSVISRYQLNLQVG